MAKVKELIAMLAELPEDMEVWASSDGEGNDYHTVDEAHVTNVIMRQYGIDPIANEDLPYYRDEAEEGIEQVVILW